MYINIFRKLFSELLFDYKVLHNILRFFIFEFFRTNFSDLYLLKV
jgi:hypothetical protein